MTSTTKPLWKHQKATLELLRRQPRVLDFSDPGTGKTRVHLEAFAERRKRGCGKAVVTCPKTLMESAWLADLQEFTPGLHAVIARAENRDDMLRAAAASDVDVLITNVDAIKVLNKLPRRYWDKFDTWIGDEWDAFKHRTSARSKAAAALREFFFYRAGLTGTPNPNSVTELWHQALLIDDGRRLGNNFWRFQTECCIPEQTGPRPEHIKWVDRDGIEAVVGELLRDITVRHEFDECMDIPPNTVRTVKFRPGKRLMAAYKKMEHDAVLELKDRAITAVHAAALRTKMLQIASGAVYGNDGEYGLIDGERYELIGELVQEVKHPSVTFFSWAHQRDGLVKEMESRKITYEVIDGSVTQKGRREQIVRDYQAGKIRSLLMHPATGAHGLTLTAGRRTIISSPLDRADWMKQAVHRIHRGGQQHKTETILVEATGTIEGGIYARTQGKGERMSDLLSIIKEANQ
jgi:SNF2 family DNA or RNA helicase